MRSLNPIFERPKDIPLIFSFQHSEDGIDYYTPWSYEDWIAVVNNEGMWYFL